MYAPCGIAQREDLPTGQNQCFDKIIQATLHNTARQAGWTSGSEKENKHAKNPTMSRYQSNLHTETFMNHDGSFTDITILCLIRPQKV